MSGPRCTKHKDFEAQLEFIYITDLRRYGVRVRDVRCRICGASFTFSDEATALSYADPFRTGINHLLDEDHPDGAA